MRRALDAARSKLASLRDRDAILDCFFEHSSNLFEFAALFIVRGDSAQGRNVHGLAAPDGLVERVVVSLIEPGILTRARELRRPVVGIPNMTEADEGLFGMLGRTMPAGIAVPLVVRDRVVAILLGDAPAEQLDARAREAGRTPMALAKEEMLVWAESVGETLESLILRVKKSSGGSVPPPRFASTPSPEIPSVPPPPRVPREVSSPPPAPAMRSAPPRTFPPPPAPALRRGTSIALVAAGVLALAALALFFWRFNRAEPDLSRVVAAGDTLPGWPAAVDPGKAIDAARTASGLGADAELAVVRASVRLGGVVDFSAAHGSDEGPLLGFEFVDTQTEAEVSIDRAGIHAPRAQGRRMCEDKPCRSAVPTPQCGFDRVWAAARAVGLRDEDRAFVTYSAGGSGGGAPRWVVAVRGRGQAAIDAATCKPLPRQAIRPPPIPASAIPGAPGAVDPSEVAELARTIAALEKDAVLLEVDASGLSNTGKVDLRRSDGTIVYTFSDPQDVPASARQWRQVDIRAEGMRVTADEIDRGPLPARFDTTVPPPRCSFASAFAYLTLEQSGITTARLTYGSDLSAHQGRWTLELPGTASRTTSSDDECEAWASLHDK